MKNNMQRHSGTLLKYVALALGVASAYIYGGLAYGLGAGGAAVLVISVAQYFSSIFNRDD